MSLSAIPVALVVPPINVLLLSLVGALIACRYRMIGCAMVAAGLGGMLLLSLPLVSRLLLVSLETDLPLVPAVDPPPAAIVVLSGDTARDSGVPEVGHLTLERLRTGATLYRRTHLPVLVSGGHFDETDETLARLMALSLIEDFHVPVSWIEAESTDTTGNATFSAAILRNNGIRSIYLVTHAWHMKRALQAFAHTGIAVTAVPVRMDGFREWQLGDFVPRVNAWLDSYYGLHEWIGLAAAASITK